MSVMFHTCPVFIQVMLERKLEKIIEAYKNQMWCLFFGCNKFFLKKIFQANWS